MLLSATACTDDAGSDAADTGTGAEPTTSSVDESDTGLDGTPGTVGEDVGLVFAMHGTTDPITFQPSGPGALVTMPTTRPQDFPAGDMHPIFDPAQLDAVEPTELWSNDDAWSGRWLMGPSHCYQPPDAGACPR